MFPLGGDLLEASVPFVRGTDLAAPDGVSPERDQSGRSAVPLLPVPPERPIQQISVAEISSFVVHVLENRDELIGERIDIASDELSGVEVARILSDVTGRSIEYVETSLAEAYEANKDAATMYEWFDRVGYSADIKGLRSAYPHVGWRTFEEWARSQDWSAVTAAGTASVSP